MSFAEKFPLRVKLIALSVVVNFVLGFASWELLHQAVETGKGKDRNRAEAAARSLAGAISAQFFERYGDVQAFASNTIMLVGDRTSISESLNAYISMYQIYDMIVIVDTKGHLVASNTISATGKNLDTSSLKDQDFSSAPWFKAVIGGKFTEDKDRGFAGTFVEDPTFDDITSKVYGKQMYGNSFSAPIKNKAGQVIGVISNRANFRWVEDEFIRSYSVFSEDGLKTQNYTLLDGSGHVILQHNPLASGGKNEIAHDSAVLGKMSLDSSEGSPAKLARDGKFGSVMSAHPITKEIVVAGYAPLVDAKFVPSMNWSVQVYIDDDELFADFNRVDAYFYQIFLVLNILTIAGGWIFSSRIGRALTAIAERLSKGANETRDASQAIAASSGELSQSATEQAAALQEAVASINEISAMVEKTADNAGRSQTNARQSQGTIQDGRKAVEDVVLSMSEIKDANKLVMEQIAQNNKEITDIVNVISEIGAKTKVINDIVFQTKLLSFNASVEAARAGEHGKGFAVVAEEVGNLAQMSGNAAREISEMLGASVQKVNQIASTTQQNVERLLAQGRSVLERADENAKRCDDAFGRVMKDADEVFTSLTEIATASREQAQGIQEVNKAMGQLDKLTQNTMAVSNSTAASASQLNSQAGTLTEVVSGLRNLIMGARANSKHVEAAPPMAEVPKTKAKLVLKQAAKPAHAKVIPIKTSVKQERVLEVSGKMASGAAGLPDADDPRFEEI